MRLGENFRLPDRRGWLNIDDDRTPHRSDNGGIGEESRPAMAPVQRAANQLVR